MGRTYCLYTRYPIVARYNEGAREQRYLAYKIIACMQDTVTCVHGTI